MKFYKHYKNKPYRYHGIAKHSESLEDYVIYECLYPNELAKMWIRPKKMFEENIVLDSVEVARFKKIKLITHEFENITNQIQTIQSLCQNILGSEAKNLSEKLSQSKRFYLVTAEIESKIVGFKLGYEISSDCFYSWLGGVLSEYQGLGIANELAEVQESWCKRNSYKKIQTKTQNRYKEMLILNLNRGFQIIGFEKGEWNQEKIILEKNL